MIKNKRIAPVVALAATALGLAIPAYSLWSDADTAGSPGFTIGAVSFGAAPAAAAYYAMYPDDLGFASPISPATNNITAAEPGPFTMSVDGGPVTIAVPGSVIAQVLNQDSTDPDCSLAAPGVPCSTSPIIWSFVVDGRAPQSVGLNYLVTATGQVPAGTYGTDGYKTGEPLVPSTSPGQLSEPSWGGVGSSDTLLGYSTVSIYPAGGTPSAPQCGNVPPLPADFYDTESGLPDAGAPNVYVYNAPVVDPSSYDSDAQLNEEYPTQLAPNPDAATAPLGTLVPGVISQPGVADDSGPNQQVWCVAIQFINVPDQNYNQQAYLLANGATPQGGADSNVYTALQQWGARVATPPSLPKAGYYVDIFSGTATGDNDSTAEDDEVWWAELYPDPNNEPDLLIQLDPIVTNINPKYSVPNKYVPTSSSNP